MASTAVYWHYNATDTGLVLKVYDETAGTLVNGAGGDALTHDANGRYTAAIAETLSGRYRVVVENGSGIMLSEGFSNIVDGGTNVMGLWEASTTQATTIISDIATVDTVVDGTAATVSANLDVAVSTRLAYSDYEAPDNASIADILEDTGTTIPGQIAAIGGGGGGSGARTVTITVDDGTDPLEAATVRLTEGINSYAVATDASGEAVFNVDDATYTVAITKAGYSFNGASLVVSGDQSETYSMTQIVFPGSSAPLCSVLIRVLDQYGDALANEPVTIRFNRFSNTATETPLVLSPPPVLETDGSGEVTVDLLRLAEYTILFGSAPYTRRVDVTVPDAGSYVVEE